MNLPVESTLDQCIKCNICTAACPVSAVTDAFPGPKYEGAQAGRFRSFALASPDLSVDYCSGCRVCNMVCPTGVKIAEINARARARMVELGKTSARHRLRNNLVARAALIGQLAQPIHLLANAVFFFAPGRWLMDRMLGIAQNAPFPHFASQKFSTWFNRRQPVSKGQRKVVYFHGCSTEYYEPRIGKAAVHVLEANGFEVIVPEQNCCGLPLLSNGEFNTARRYHESNIRHLSKFARQGIPIVGTSTSCTLTLKEEAPELLDMQDEDTLLFARMTYDLNEFLLILYDEGSLNLDLQPISLELPYHVPCQYRAHRLGFPGMEILELIPGLRINESQAVCCGIAGTYGYKSERYEIAMQVGKPLFEFILSADAPLVVCDSETCRWQITHATQKKSIHPIELLALSYGYKPEGPLEMLINRV